MNAEQLLIARSQWRRFGPPTITAKVGGKDKKFSFDHTYSLHDNGVLLLRYKGRSSKNDTFPPMIGVNVELDEGQDLYNLTFRVYDGEMNLVETERVDGLCWDQFANCTTIRGKGEELQ